MRVSSASFGILALSSTLAFAAAPAADPTATDPKLPPLEGYSTDTRFSIEKCSLTYKLALAKAENKALMAQTGERPPDESEEQKKMGDYVTCIKTGKATAKTFLDKSMRTLKKPAAREALKSYHVAFLSALEGIPAADGEIRMMYSQRQAALRARMSEAWSRFEIEQ